MKHKQYKSSAHYILKALIPYTEANLLLSYKPNLFFNELERISNKNRRTLENEFYRLKRDGYIQQTVDSVRLTDEGLAQLELFEPKHIEGDAKLMIIFDIPENLRHKRDALRSTLKLLRFRQVQKSVWLTEYECRMHLTKEIKTNQLQDYVRFFEAKQLDT